MRPWCVGRGKIKRGALIGKTPPRPVGLSALIDDAQRLLDDAN
jgi:hypothetical protein